MIYQFDNIPNFRGLGGYTMQDGRTVRKGRLLRGGYLGDASDNDIRRLSEEFDVKHVFDFRSDMERQIKPDREIPGAKATWLPTIDMYTDQQVEMLPHDAYIDLEGFLIRECFTDKVKYLARTMYPSMIDNEYTQLQYAAFIQNIINTPYGAIYWHCSQGKDRTGLGAAFLLFALGADRETVVKDFDLSNDFYREEIDRTCKVVIEKGGGEEECDAVRSFLGVGTRNFEYTLDKIDADYGGIMPFIQNMLMVGDEDIEVLRERYLE